jgi:pro-kumamolisin-like protein
LEEDGMRVLALPLAACAVLAALAGSRASDGIAAPSLAARPPAGATATPVPTPTPAPKPTPNPVCTQGTVSRNIVDPVPPGWAPDSAAASAGDDMLSVTIVLSPSSSADVDDRIAQQSDPNDVRNANLVNGPFRTLDDVFVRKQWATSGARALIDYLRQQRARTSGSARMQLQANRFAVNVRATRDVLEHVFCTRFEDFTEVGTGRRAIRPHRAPRVPGTAVRAVSAIAGLNTFELPQPNVESTTDRSRASSVARLVDAYGIDSARGTGETAIGFLERGAPSQANLNRSFALNSVPGADGVTVVDPSFGTALAASDERQAVLDALAGTAFSGRGVVVFPICTVADGCRADGVYDQLARMIERARTGTAKRPRLATIVIPLSMCAERMAPAERDALGVLLRAAALRGVPVVAASTRAPDCGTNSAPLPAAAALALAVAPTTVNLSPPVELPYASAANVGIGAENRPAFQTAWLSHIHATSASLVRLVPDVYALGDPKQGLLICPPAADGQCPATAGTALATAIVGSIAYRIVEQTGALGALPLTFYDVATRDRAGFERIAPDDGGLFAIGRVRYGGALANAFPHLPAVVTMKLSLANTPVGRMQLDIDGERLGTVAQVPQSGDCFASIPESATTGAVPVHLRIFDMSPDGPASSRPIYAEVGQWNARTIRICRLVVPTKPASKPRAPLPASAPTALPTLPADFVRDGDALRIRLAGDGQYATTSVVRLGTASGVPVPTPTATVTIADKVRQSSAFPLSGTISLIPSGGGTPVPFGTDVDLVACTFKPGVATPPPTERCNAAAWAGALVAHPAQRTVQSDPKTGAFANVPNAESTPLMSSDVRGPVRIEAQHKSANQPLQANTINVFCTTALLVQPAPAPANAPIALGPRARSAQVKADMLYLLPSFERDSPGERYRAVFRDREGSEVPEPTPDPAAPPKPTPTPFPSANLPNIPDHDIYVDNAVRRFPLMLTSGTTYAAYINVERFDADGNMWHPCQSVRFGSFTIP